MDTPDFDELIKRASQPIEPSAQKADPKSGNYSDKQTHSDKKEQE